MIVCLPRVIAGMSFQRVLQQARELLDMVPTDKVPETWDDQRNTCIHDLETIFANVSFESIKTVKES